MLARHASLLNAFLLTSFSILGLVAVDCGGHTTTTTGGASGSSATGTGTGAGGSTGECSSGLDGSTLAGNWHAIGTRLGGPQVALEISLDAQHLSIQGARGSFVAQKNGGVFSITYAEAGSTAGIVATQQIAGSVALGAIPIDFSGSWTFRNAVGPSGGGPDPFGCDATLSAGTITAICSNTRLPRWVSLYNPGPGSATGTKTAEGSSVFGDLSGTWSVPLTGEGCTFRFEGSTFASDCGPRLGSMRMTFCGSIASGTTSSGIEFSAQRL